MGFGALQLTTGEEKVPSLLWGFFKLLALWKMLPDGKQSSFYNIQKRREKLPDEFRVDVQSLMALLAAGKLKPAVADCVPLENAADVHRKIDKGDVAGKIVLLCNSQIGM